MTGLLFALALVGLAALAEWWLCAHGLDSVREDLYPEQGVVEPDEVFCLCIRLRNMGRWPVPYLRASLLLPREFVPQDMAHARQDRDQKFYTVSYSVWLRPRQEAVLRVPVRVPRRGRYVLDRLTVRGDDFLGLTGPLRQLERFNEIVVAPRAVPEPAVQALLGGVLGDVSVNRFLYEDPILTVGCREYTGREPMKQIAWAQSARGRGLLVRQADYTTEPSVTVLVNVEMPVSAQRAAQLEACFSLARTVCQILEKRGVPYALATNSMLETGRLAGRTARTGTQGGMEVKRGLGEAHFRRALEVLGRATGQADRPGGLFLERAAGEGGVHSRILITPEAGMPEAGALARLRAASGGSLQILTPQEVEAQ